MACIVGVADDTGDRRHDGTHKQPRKERRKPLDWTTNKPVVERENATTKVR
jgi:hypothetical protein